MLETPEQVQRLAEAIPNLPGPFRDEQTRVLAGEVLRLRAALREAHAESEQLQDKLDGWGIP